MIAARSLGSIGKDNAAVVEALQVSANTDSDNYVVENSIDALVSLGKTDAVTVDLRSQNPITRKIAVEAFGHTHPIPNGTLDVLRPLLSDPDEGVRYATLNVFCEAGIAAQGAIVEISSELQDASARNRVLAARTLAYFGPQARQWIPELERMTGDEDQDARTEAIRTLGWIGPSANAAIPQLLGALRDSKTRDEAHRALLKIATQPRDLRSAYDSRDPTLVSALRDINQQLQARNKTVSLRATLYNGSSVSIAVDQRTIVIAMGTWCPHSKLVRDFFVDPSNQAYFRDYRMVFLFEDEWLHARSFLIAQHEWDAEAALIDKKHEARDAPYLDPSFVEGLGGKIYIVHSLADLGLRYYPSVLSPKILQSEAAAPRLGSQDWIDVGDWKDTDWFKEHVLMPQQVESDLESGVSLFGL